MEEVKKVKIEELIVDAEFKNSIPPLSEEEFNLLKDSVSEEGCRDSLIIWKGKNILLDGHNRRNILLDLGVSEVNVIEKEFADRNDARIWIIENQFGRRNISKFDRCILALRLEDFYKTKAKEKQISEGKNLGGTLCQKSDKGVIHVNKELAKIAGVSHDTISKVKKIEEFGDPEAKEKIRRGDLSIKQAFDLIKEKEKSGNISSKKDKEKLEDKESESMANQEELSQKEEIIISQASVTTTTAPSIIEISKNSEIEVVCRGLECFNNKNFEEALKCFEEGLSICRKKLHRPEPRASHYMGVL